MEIHASLNNLDHLRYLISRVHNSIHPHGQGILGLVHAFSSNLDNIREYVQKIAFFEDGHILVLCMNKDMAVKLLHAQYFQVDLTFKRVCGKINEFELNEYDINYNITFTYAQIFTNIATANAYHRMFKAIIEAVNELCKQEVQTRHIHNNGWKVILGNLDAAQAKGLGLVLADLDPTKTWETHLTYIFKSCRVHYKRKVFKTFIKSI
ncbi:hypothetical protein C2G38_1501526 [Gigaspora rosea]|uniref:MULE transposase domain-containing protein n=1 Tax=Gigaspora rosea TaxID=44941 RepID=A0A397V3S6_9GLOM|nr:hypothetical protein C2G38_1501526 [Gigaspora rosea]